MDGTGDINNYTLIYVTDNAQLAALGITYLSNLFEAASVTEPCGRKSWDVLRNKFSVISNPDSGRFPRLLLP